MRLDNDTFQKDPPQEDIKFILNLFNLKKFLEVKKEIDIRKKKYPNSSILFNILGAVFYAEEKFDKAIENYKKAIFINPNYAQAYNNLGTVLHKLNKINEAIKNYKKAMDLKNNFAEAFNNLGNAMKELKKFDESLKYLTKAIQIKSDYAEAYNNLGSTHERLGNKKSALENYQKAVKIKPEYAEAYNNLGMLFSDLARFDDALSSYNKAIDLDSNYEKPHNNLGNLFNNLGKFDEATLAYYEAIKIKTNYPKAYSNLLFNLNYKTNFDQNLYLLEAKNFSSNCKPVKKNFSHKYYYDQKPKKLKIGFVSADFGNHPGGFFTLSTFKELKKKNFELFAYSTAERKDELVSHFKPLFSKWNTVENNTDEEIVEIIIKDGIHILIDSQGHSAKNRLPIFFYKPAPIQASWLSQGSTGISEIDYFIGSPHLTPKNEEKNYVEKVIRLPEISQCFTAPIFDVKINDLPAKKNRFITFGSVNKLTKMNDDVVVLWSKILSSISNSKLLLKNRDLEDKNVFKNTIKRFEKQNVDKNNLILLGHAKTRKELLEAYNRIDISLDPFPFQGNTSTCESVWMGVPVITLKGDRYLSHFGESINSNLDMEEWIALNHQDYVSKAINFSSNIEELSKIRMNLREKALRSPVFDATRFTNHFSKMLWDMWMKYNRNNK